MRKLVLVVSLCAFALALVPGRAAAADPCGRPDRQPNWIDFGTTDFVNVFARPGTILAVAGGDFPATVRAAGVITVYWDMYLNQRVGTTTAPADPATIADKANRLFDFAAAQSACSTPWIAENEFSGANLVTPLSATNAQYRQNVLTYLQTLAARGARPFLLVPSRPYLGGDAAAWWQQVAAVADIVRETYFNAKTIYVQGSIVGNRTLRTVMRTSIADFLAIGIPASRLGVMIGFQTTPGQGGREQLQPAGAWYETVKWQALSARRVAQELAISTIWSWGWGTWSAGEQDPDKKGAACVWLWVRASALCDGLAAAGPGWDASLTEGQIRLAAGVQCTVGRSTITTGAIAQLQGLTVDREVAYSALLARSVESRAAPVTSQQILAAERAVIDARFNGDEQAYRNALANAGVPLGVARGILADELRRGKIARTLRVKAPSAAEVQTFYESYPDLLVRQVTASPAPPWLGGRSKGFALDLIAPSSVFRLSNNTAQTLRTLDGTFRVKATGDAQPLGSMPLVKVEPAIRAALTSFAQGVAFGDWTTAQQKTALNDTICRDDDLPVPGSIELETFLPFLSATG